MKAIYTWSAILAIVFGRLCAMKQVGQVGALWRRSGVWCRDRTDAGQSQLFGVMAMAVAFFSLLFALSWQT